MIRGFCIERLREGEAQRPEGRSPEECEAGRIAQLAPLERLQEHVAAIDEPGEAQRRILRSARHREQRLEAAGRLAVAAHRSPVDVLRAERKWPVAAHRARTAGEEGLEERQRLVAGPPGRAELAAGEEREVARDREIRLVLIAEADILEVALRHLARQPDEGAGTCGD